VPWLSVINNRKPTCKCMRHLALKRESLVHSVLMGTAHVHPWGKSLSIQ
jgi:hypothetical protein